MGKTKLQGTYSDYEKILAKINSIIDHELYGLGWGISDLAYHIKDKDVRDNEREIYDAVKTKLYDIKQILEEIL